MKVYGFIKRIFFWWKLRRKLRRSGRNNAFFLSSSFESQRFNSVDYNLEDFNCRKLIFGLRKVWHFSSVSCVRVNWKKKWRVLCIADTGTRLYIHRHWANKCPFKKREQTKVVIKSIEEFVNVSRKGNQL